MISIQYAVIVEISCKGTAKRFQEFQEIDGGSGYDTVVLVQEILHHLGCTKYYKLPTSTGEFTEFLNHQQPWMKVAIVDRSHPSTNIPAQVQGIWDE